VSAGVEFPADDVLRHADTLSESAAAILQARSAAGEVAMGSQAYGQLCQFLPVLLSPLFASATDVMNDAVDALEETALNLRRTARDMTATDGDSADRLGAAGRPGVDLPL
jgi:hypothetical protein